MIHELVNPQGVTRADIAVFIPSYEEAETIGLPVRKVSMGLKKFYPHLNSVIVNCDNNSRDKTKEAFFAAECDVPRIYASTAPGVRGKGANLVNAFNLAARLSAQAVALVDANITSIKSTWIQSLLAPILEGGCQYVIPIYVRHRYDAPLTRGLVYPMTRCLYGRRVFQPISIEHAFSGQVNEVFRARQWETDDRGYKADLEMLAAVAENRIPICQTIMGHPRVTTLGKLDHDLSKAFTYTTRALFDLMIRTLGLWPGVKRSRPTILYGADTPQQVSPPMVVVDRDYLQQSFIDLGRKYRPVWREIFSPELEADLGRALEAAEQGEVKGLDVHIWRRAIWEASAVYQQLPADRREEAAASLCPMFFGKGLNVQLWSENMSGPQYRANLDDEAMAFEAAKGELSALWKVGSKDA